jgi:hypothetical protein
LLFFHERRKDYRAAMKPIFVFLALVCTAAGARADLVMQQQISIATNNSVATIKVKGSKIRLDLSAGRPQAVSTITDLKTGDVITLFHKQKMYVKTPGAPPKQTQPAGDGATANPAPKPPLPQPTGQTQKVGSYDTDLYSWSNSRGIIGTAWVAKNYPDYARIRTDLAVLDKSAAEANNYTDPALSTLPGMVVRSQVAGDGPTIIAALISARKCRWTQRSFKYQPAIKNCHGQSHSSPRFPKSHPVKPRPAGKRLITPSSELAPDQPRAVELGAEMTLSVYPAAI